MDSFLDWMDGLETNFPDQELGFALLRCTSCGTSLTVACTRVCGRGLVGVVGGVRRGCGGVVGRGEGVVGVTGVWLGVRV